MNMPNKYYQEKDLDYQAEGEARGDSKEKVARQRRFSYSRSNRPAASHNGIHRRRNKRFSW
jgi:hypothetical protein